MKKTFSTSKSKEEILAQLEDMKSKNYRICYEPPNKLIYRAIRRRHSIIWFINIDEPDKITVKSQHFFKSYDYYSCIIMLISINVILLILSSIDAHLIISFVIIITNLSLFYFKIILSYLLLVKHDIKKFLV